MRGGEIIMKLKKLLILCTAAALVLPAGLAGCGDKDSEQTGSDHSEKDGNKDVDGKEDGDKDENALSDTIRWFNASYAILTELNGWDYNIFAGLEPNFSVQSGQKKSLEEWWGVTDRQTADETLDWILEEGHRLDFAANASYLEECGMGELAESDRLAFLLDNFDVTDEEAEGYISSYKMYEQFGAEAIDGWDYCRALNLMSFFYLAGYYTEEEALDKSLEIAVTLQEKFDSWDALVDSYLRGYEYWAEESSDERREVYEDLKKRKDNPYSVDYDTALEKTW